MVSVIIPAYNEAHSIRSTIAYLFANACYRRLLKEVIVVDGGSADNTLREAREAGAQTFMFRKKSRAALANYGASKATGSILYFVQPGTLPPPDFISEIVKVTGKGFAVGTFRLRFDHPHWILGFISQVANRYSDRIQLCDQSLFITKELFDKSGGFREDYLVMINQEMIKRMRRYSDFVVLQKTVLTTATKYLNHGFFRTASVQAVVFIMHLLGFRQEKMTWLYRKYLNWDIGPCLPEKPSAEPEHFSISPVTRFEI